MVCVGAGKSNGVGASGHNGIFTEAAVEVSGG